MDVPIESGLQVVMYLFLSGFDISNIESSLLDICFIRYFSVVRCVVKNINKRWLLCLGLQRKNIDFYSMNVLS